MRKRINILRYLILIIIFKIKMINNKEFNKHKIKVRIEKMKIIPDKMSPNIMSKIIKKVNHNITNKITKMNLKINIKIVKQNPNKILTNLKSKIRNSRTKIKHKNLNLTNTKYKQLKQSKNITII